MAVIQPVIQSIPSLWQTHQNEKVKELEKRIESLEKDMLELILLIGVSNDN